MELPDDVNFEKIERSFVKETYDEIAQDFSATRYKKWPKVSHFIESLPSTSLLLDVGCGNGKYLDNNLLFSIGCDISHELLAICKKRGHEVVLCDMTRLPFRTGLFDALICIAALHHISTSIRREKCLNEMTNLLTSKGGEILVQVWSYEQDNRDKSNPYLKKNSSIPSEVLERTVSIDDQVSLPVHINRTPFKHQDLLVPFQKKLSNLPSEDHATSKLNTGTVQCLRFYHVFKENELEQMLSKISNMSLINSYYDKGNWCIVGRRKC